MLTNLPESIQEQILFYLEANNFRAAKELRDQSMQNASFANGSIAMPLEDCADPLFA